MRNVVLCSIVVGAVCALSGCEPGNVGAPISLRPAPSPPYAQDSPEHALRLLEWSYEHRDLDHYLRLFTADFRFAFSDIDSSGAAYRTVPWRREDEIIATRHLFYGGDADQPAAVDIRLTLDRNFNVVPDERAGKDARWHKRIDTQLVLHVLLADGHADDITGSARFYFTRGDSAFIPDDLGVGPDSTVWYVDRWEDMTAQDTGGARFPRIVPASLQAAGNATWGSIKVLYR